MNSDTLFQFGMGPVELDATQTEEFLNARSAPDLRFVAFCAPGSAVPELRLRGNRAKALITRA